MNHKKVWNLRKMFVVSALCSVGACTCMARGPEQYRDDTRAVLEERNDQIKSCYDTQLEGSPETAGSVVVKFTVEKETGVFKDVALDSEKTTAPEPLAQCVLSALEGLKLDPVDKRDGLATFTWEFKSYDQEGASTDEDAAEEDSSAADNG